MEKALEIITDEIAILEMALGDLREQYDRANDTNRTQDQIAIAVRITDVAIRVEALKKLHRRLTEGR